MNMDMDMTTNMDMDMGMDMTMSMKNYFYSTAHATILFKQWHTMTWAELLGSCIGVAVLAALYEGLKVGRELVDAKMRSSSSIAPNVGQGCECANRDDQSRSTANSGGIVINDGSKGRRGSSWRQHPICQLGHFVQTLLYFVQLWVGLCLMLIMTFNVFLCLAVTVGGAVGHFCFAWAKHRPGSEDEQMMCH